MSRNWIQTFTGMKINPLDAKPEQLVIEDIAVSLSRQCRYTGHTKRFYSVAEHSIIVASHLPDELKAWGLMHDATEAYLVDIARPVKHTPEFRQYREIEHRLEKVVAERFGLDYPMPKEIKDIDNLVGAMEAKEMMIYPHTEGDDLSRSRLLNEWGVWIDVEPIDGCKFYYLDHQQALLGFLESCSNLIKAGWLRA